MDFAKPQRDGKLSIIYLRPLDLSVDETMREILDVVERTGAKRVVIDSLAGFEMALAPSLRTDFRESLYRMNSKDIREYEVTSEGVRIGERLTGYHGLITGVPEPLNPRDPDGKKAPVMPDCKD
jgi:KaiC/GvpD/RAD55 family RecA-like ATPase